MAVRLLGILLLLATAPMRVRGQATLVAPADPVYDLIQRLNGVGVLTDGVLGQRPLARREIQRLLAGAMSSARLAELAPTLRGQLERALVRFRPDSAPNRSVPRIDLAGFRATVASSPPRPITRTAGIDVALNPLLAYREGAPAVDGVAAGLFMGGSYAPRSWLSVHADVDGGWHRVRGRTASPDLLVRRANAVGLLRNIALTVGRDQQFFGQSDRAGMLLSLDPRGLDMIRAGAATPFRIPVVSAIMGPVLPTFFVADLGGGQNFPHPQLIGYKVSARPADVLEVGASLTNQMGGRGAPAGTLSDRLADLLPLIDGLFLHRTLLFSNKFAGIDARLRIPRWGAQLYMDGAVDDFDLRRFRSSVAQDGGYVWGLTLDCLYDCGRGRLRAEYQTTGLRYYTHGYYQSGYTIDRRFLGNALGPSAQGGYLAGDIFRDRATFGIEAAHEIRSGDVWGTASTTPDDSDFHFIILEHRPAERRWRVTSKIHWEVLNDVARVQVRVGLERVSRFGFDANVHKNNFLLESRFQVTPRR